MSKDQQVKLRTYNISTTVIIEMRGNIQQFEADELEEMLYNVLDEKKKNIIIDMHNVSNICSSALGLMVNFKKLLNEQGGDLKVVVSSPQIYELFKVTMMDRVFDTMDNVQEAVNAF